jgi:hypothetical protein
MVEVGGIVSGARALVLSQAGGVAGIAPMSMNTLAVACAMGLGVGRSGNGLHRWSVLP